MADFRDLIRQESCSPEEYARREAEKKLAAEEKPYRDDAEKWSEIIKSDIRKKASRGEYKIVNGKRCISSEVSLGRDTSDFLPYERLHSVMYRYILRHWIILELEKEVTFNTAPRSGYDLDSTTPLYQANYIADVLQPKSFRTPAKKRLHLTKGGKLFEEVLTKLLAEDGIKISAYFVEYEVLEKSRWEEFWEELENREIAYTVTGRPIYRDDIVFEADGKHWFIRAYKYEFWY